MVLVCAGKKKDLWYLDSGCSRHMNGDQSMLTRFEEKAGPGVTFGYDNKRFTLGYGMIEKDNVIIDKVALVDGFKHNILTISRLCDNGNKVHFSQGSCFIASKESGDILLTGNMKGNIYIADFNSSNVDFLTCLLKGICHSLFVITRTQLKLNKIVISKQYLESHNVTHVRKGTKIASTVLKIILTGRSSYE